MAACKAIRNLYQNNKRGKLGRKTLFLGEKTTRLSVFAGLNHANFT
jgi:Na+/H+-dicarboxylate symporter